FGEPLAFAQTQENWRTRPAVSLGEHALALATLEPLWSIFDPASPCWWQRPSAELHPLFSLHLANPIYFLLAIALLVLGWWKQWLNRAEIVFVLCLLAIPYLTRSHEMCMAGMGRFAATAFPLYLVLGRLLAGLPAPVAACLCGL